MKTVSHLLFLLSCIIIISSCSSLKNTNKKMVTGSWKNALYATMDPGQEKEEKPAGAEKITASDENPSDVPEKGANGQGNNISLEFRTDKTATIINTGKTLNGTWKLDQTGNIILFTENTTDTVIKLQLVRVNSVAMGLLEQSTQGDIVVRYFREK
jgi:hypothetical protein